jgi:adenine specific DNA methylase Mod
MYPVCTSYTNQPRIFNVSIECANLQLSHSRFWNNVLKMAKNIKAQSLIIFIQIGQYSRTFQEIFCPLPGYS